MDRHTPEPWGVSPSHSELGRIRVIAGDDDLETIAAAYCRSDGYPPLPTEMPNARRIVAAVNACAGISTEALEAGAVAELVGAAEMARAMLATVAHTPCIDCGYGHNVGDHSTYTLQAVESALAKARGQKPEAQETEAQQ